MPKRILRGKVISNKNNKTVIVEITRKVKHQLYKKIINRIKKFHAHDENNICNIGDDVRIQESRPISKLKRWVVLNEEENQQ